MKKILISCVLLLCLVSCNNQARSISFIGHKVLNISLEEQYNCDYLLDKVDSKKLLNFVENNVTSNNKNKDLKTIIKRSKTIFISLGIYDIMKNVSLVDGELVLKYYDSVNELFELNLVHIIDEIRSINSKVNLNILSTYVVYINDGSTFYKEYSLAVYRYNKTIENICNENSCKYVDITFLSDYIMQYNTISEYCQDRFFELIKKYE